MKLLIDLQHPAHLHFFRPMAGALERQGHEVRWTGRRKDVLPALAEAYGIRLELFGTARQGSRLHMAIELAIRMTRLAWILRRDRPDVVMAIAGTYVALPARILGIRSCGFTDTEHASLSHRLTFPWLSELYVPRAYRDAIERPHVRYRGYHELAYLHPRVFQPDPTVLAEAGLEGREPVVLVRFVRWGAAHDWGREGTTERARRAALEALGQEATVVVSSEDPLPDDLEPLRVRLPPHRLHDLMAHVALVFGESATMASEAAVLGVPSVFLDPVGRGYTDEQEARYGLVATLPPEEIPAALDEARARLRMPRERWEEARGRLLRDAVDVADLLTEIALGESPSAHAGMGGKETS